jgi:hypothetical protein
MKAPQFDVIPTLPVLCVHFVCVVKSEHGEVLPQNTTDDNRKY